MKDKLQIAAKKIKKVPASIAKNNKQREHRQEKEQRRLFFLPVFHLPEHSDVRVNGESSMKIITCFLFVPDRGSAIEKDKLTQ